MSETKQKTEIRNNKICTDKKNIDWKNTCIGHG